MSEKNISSKAYVKIYPNKTYIRKIFVWKHVRKNISTKTYLRKISVPKHPLEKHQYQNIYKKNISTKIYVRKMSVPKLVGKIPVPKQGRKNISTKTCEKKISIFRLKSHFICSHGLSSSDSRVLALGSGGFRFDQNPGDTKLVQTVLHLVLSIDINSFTATGNNNRLLQTA